MRNIVILLSRSTSMARVGVWTRPTFRVRWYSTEKSLVALIPMSQSAFWRQRADWYSGSYSAPGRRSAKPSRMAASSIEEIHSREKGFWHPAIS